MAWRDSGKEDEVVRDVKVCKWRHWIFVNCGVLFEYKSLENTQRLYATNGKTTL